MPRDKRAPTIPPGEAYGTYHVTGLGYGRELDTATVDVYISTNAERAVDVNVTLGRSRGSVACIHLTNAEAVETIRAIGVAMLHAADTAAQLGFLPAPTEG